VIDRIRRVCLALMLHPRAGMPCPARVPGAVRRAWRLLQSVVIASSLSAGVVGAQTNGALFLLVPFGARAVGQGDAVVADTSLGTEGLWWNAAAMARMTKQELAIHHSQTAFATNDMLTYARPSKVLGTLAASAYIVNYGDLPVTVNNGEVSVGTSTNRNYMFALAYATPAGSRLSAGLTYKFVMLRLTCTGICGSTNVLSGNTQALDFGVQYRVPGTLPFTVGAAIRNIGPALQLKDKDQADPLPQIIQVGAKLRVPVPALAQTGATLDVSADVIQSAAIGGGSGGVGVVLGYRDILFLRGGYKVQPGDGGGPSIGLGLERGGFSLDFARRFDGLSAQLGQSPTYVSLRARF
jgi:hypothetical protein